MAFIDYYKIMGVPKDIPQSELHNAYKRRVKQFHSDLHQDDPKAKAKMQALNEAKEVLLDPEKRRKYDKYGQNWEQADAYERAAKAGGMNGGGAYGGYGADGMEGFDFSQFGGQGGGFSSFFEDLFGAMGGSARGGTNFGQSASARVGAYNLNASVTIDLYTAMLGGEILLQTPGCKLRLKVKPETQNGAKVRLRGKGRQKPDGTFGDLIITYNVQLPTGLSESQRNHLRAMRDNV